jgi:hypothetical protein
MSVVTELFHWLRKLSQSVIRNRVTEQDIREWLTDNGYDGQTAKLSSVELVAIERPGWRQVYQFKVKILVLDQWTNYAGIIRVDDRYSKTQVELFDESTITGQSRLRGQLDTGDDNVSRQRRKIDNEDDEG